MSLDRGFRGTVWANIGLSIAVAVITLMCSQSARAELLVFNALTVADNVAQRNAWLASIGIAAPANLVDFESGFVQGQNISGINLPAGLVITDVTAIVPARQITITGLSSQLGNSTPVGVFSAAGNDESELLFDFSSNPIDYFGFVGMDHTAFNITLNFVGGTSQVFGIDDTGGSGITAEFVGVFKNDLPLIASVAMSVNGGDNEWGFDNIEYGRIAVVPEPASVTLLATVCALTAAGRWRRRNS